MFEKRSITHLSSVGLLYRASNPKEIFIEMKDDGHPIKAVHRQLCPIGGNWIGKDAKKDIGPFETFLRQVQDELSLEYPFSLQQSPTLEAVSQLNDGFYAPRKRHDVHADEGDLHDLEIIKHYIATNAVPFGDFVHVFPTHIITDCDPSSTKEGFTSLTSYFTVAFSEDVWEKIVRLQNKFGNISNESVTLLTSLDEILALKQKSAFSHDRVLKLFFEKMTHEQISEFPLVEGLSTEYVGETKVSYKEYDQLYEIKKSPFHR